MGLPTVPHLSLLEMVESATEQIIQQERSINVPPYVVNFMLVSFSDGFGCCFPLVAAFHIT